MKVRSLTTTVVSVPYRHRERSSIVSRDGVTDILVRVETDDGMAAWGESCSGGDAASVEAAVRAMAPFVIGRDPWDREAMRIDAFHRGLWHLRSSTGNFAWAGIDMALLDLCARSVGLPAYQLLGGLVRDKVSYFYYLSPGSRADLADQCRQGLAAGYDVYYLKVGMDEADDIAAVATVRAEVGPVPRIRVDANGAWSLPQAVRILDRMADFDIDFVEQPVRDHPTRHLAELRPKLRMAVCANEGLWSAAEAYERITSRQADVYCFSPYWVGSAAAFRHLALVAHDEAAQVCKHTHGELGLAAAAAHHILLTLPNVVDGNQQTAQNLLSDVLTTRLPIADGPLWGVPEGPGFGVGIDEDAVREAARRYVVDGQFLPWQRDSA